MILKNKKVLLTGGAGFIGANFVYKLLELGSDIHLIVKPQTNLWRVAPLRDHVTLHMVNLINEADIKKFIVALQPSIILHFATYGAYQRTQQNIQETINTNIVGTLNLLNACLEIPFECFINTGSNSEYGSKNAPMRESDILEPNNLYGVTKATATLYCQLIAKQKNLPIVTFRPFAVYGYFEDKPRLIPAIIRGHLTNSTFHLSSPHHVRDFIFIEDLIDAYLKAMEKIDIVKSTIFNVGSGIQYSLDEVVHLIEKIVGSLLKRSDYTIATAQQEPTVWRADISHIKNMLQWEPRFSLEEGLIKTIEWFRKNEALYL